jgi:Family of unknown function (DUF6353)
MLTGVVKQVRYARYLVNENSTTVLTGVGVVGVLTTAYLTGRASFKAARIIEKEELTYAVVTKDDDPEIAEPIRGYEFTTLEKARMVWRLYIPPVLLGATTIVSIIAANRLASKKIAALVIASGISDRALQEYKERVVEKFGENKARDIQDEIAQKRVEGEFINNEVIVLGGEVLCFDLHSGRYFHSTHEAIKRAENKINHELVHFEAASLSEFYDELGVAATNYSDQVGWDVGNQLTVLISTVMSPDNRPCLAIDFNPFPVYDYNRPHYGP